MSIIVETPFQNFTGLDGKPLTNGKVYIGQVGTDPTVFANQIPVFWDEALTIPASQPLTTNAGYIVRAGTPARVYAASAYSISVKNASNILVYYVGDVGDNILSSNIGASQIGTLNGNTVQQQFDLIYYGVSNVCAPQYAGGADPTGGIAADSAVLAAVAERKLAGGGIVYFPPNSTFKQTQLWGDGTANISFEGGGRSTVIQCANTIPNSAAVPGGAHQGQNIWLGSNAEVKNLTIDGGGFNTGGIVSSFSSDQFIFNVHMRNGGPVGCQSLQFFVSNKINVLSCSTDTALHGAQIWLCSDVTVTNYNTNKTFGGIYGAASSNVKVSGCTVSNCEDVGLDWEGGIDCTFVGNLVSSCKNAEMSVFKDGTGIMPAVGCQNLSWVGNTVHRTATYQKRDGTTEAVETGSNSGAIWFASLDAGSKNIVFENNTIQIDSFAGNMWYISSEYGAGLQDAKMIGNIFSYDGNVGPFNIGGLANGLKYQGNIHHINQGLGSPAIFKNMKGGVISDNEFYSAVTQTNRFVTFYTDVANQVECLVENNSFVGFGDLAATVDQFNSGYGSYVLKNNSFTTVQTVNGGLVVTANGLPRYNGQTLLIESADTTLGTVDVNFDAFSFLASASTSTVPAAEVLYDSNIGGAQRNLYKLLYQVGKLYSLTGSGSGSGVTASTADYLTISGATATITKVVAAPNNSYFRFDLTSSAH